jgi:hypothetical protein
MLYVNIYYIRKPSGNESEFPSFLDYGSEGYRFKSCLVYHLQTLEKPVFSRVFLVPIPRHSFNGGIGPGNEVPNLE